VRQHEALAVRVDRDIELDGEPLAERGRDRRKGVLGGSIRPGEERAVREDAEGRRGHAAIDAVRTPS